MSELREAIRDRIKSIANDPHIKERYDMYADMVLGDLREALLSEPVVEAAAMERVTGGDIEQWREYRESYPIAAASSLFDAELSLTAALVAMGAKTQA